MTNPQLIISRRKGKAIPNQGSLQYSFNEISIKSPIAFFCCCKSRTKTFKICMETQKTPNSQRNLEKEKWSW